MIKLSQAVIVEGKYDKIKLGSFIDAIIIETDGFRIFADEEKRKLIRRLAETKGIIIMTDSDGAGFKIRSYLRNIAGDKNVINVYIPDIYGKEKRKEHPSKEGKLGVEGLSEELIIKAMEKAGVAHSPGGRQGRQITVTDLYEDGLTGGENSKMKKYRLLEQLELPKRLSNSQLLQLLNIFMTYDEYKEAVEAINHS